MLRVPSSGTYVHICIYARISIYIYVCVYETEYMHSVALFLRGCLLVYMGGIVGVSCFALGCQGFQGFEGVGFTNSGELDLNLGMYLCCEKRVL